MVRFLFFICCWGEVTLGRTTIEGCCCGCDEARDAALGILLEKDVTFTLVLICDRKSGLLDNLLAVLRNILAASVVTTLLLDWI